MTKIGDPSAIGTLGSPRCNTAGKVECVDRVIAGAPRARAPSPASDAATHTAGPVPLADLVALLPKKASIGENCVLMDTFCEGHILIRRDFK